VTAVATVKQIREVMKVDGLTNDEVKEPSSGEQQAIDTRLISIPRPRSFCEYLDQFVRTFECCSDPKANQGGDEGGGLTNDEVKKNIFR
jgi:hypothetical protein